MSGLTVYLIAGEPSGDKLGAALMAGLKTLRPDIQFRGIGGPEMTALGLKSLFPMAELSIMGLVEILPKVPQLLKRIAETVSDIAQADPDVLITIDSPDFCLRVAGRARKSRPDLRTVHYVAPSVWAWRPKRADKMARSIDHVLALLPFEPPYMEAAGMSCDFVGHPIATVPVPSHEDQTALRADLGIPQTAPVLTLLPGSRGSEIRRLGAQFKEVARQVVAAHEDVHVIVPTVAAQKDTVTELFTGVEFPVHLLHQSGATDQRKLAAFATSTAALAASGTVSLELAAMGTPMVIGYRTSALTTMMVKRMAKIDTATLVNLLTETKLVPEFLFEACTSENLLNATMSLMGDIKVRERQIAGFDKALLKLGRGGEDPGLRAARSVLSVIR